ncbi:MAG TPA: DNA polymerase III subunit delta' C-terminal domain-containing protein [Pyrinomonadaceae bacterium]|jgi:DNA polymerase-3 subunit delta'
MFDKLLGNNHIKEILRRMLAKERVPRSLLFAGIEGVGKKQFALELAKSFVCLNPQNAEACDRCAACRRADKFSFPKADDKKDEFERVLFSEHPDIGVVIPYKNGIPVDAVRDLEKEANFRPYEAKARIFIIDDADKLNSAQKNAANALLKTLEEPAPTTYLFLITARPDSLLQTIVSRCQTIRFAPVETKDIQQKILGTEKFSPVDAELVARLSAGSIGRALDFDLEKFRARRETMLNALESLTGKANHLGLLKIGEEMNDARNKDDYEFYLEILQTLIHDVWVFRQGADEKAFLNVDLRTPLQKLAQTATSRRLAAWLSEIENLRETLAVNVNRKIATDALFVGMARG